MTAEIKVLKFASGTVVDPPDAEVPINVINQKFRTVEQIDAITTGASATSVANTSSIMKFTNAGLISLANVLGADVNQLLIVINDTGNDTEIVDGADIITGTGDNLSWPDGAAIFMAYIESLDAWLVVGGSGGGGASQKSYSLTNNQVLTNVTALILDQTKYTSYFIRMEVERIGTIIYRQIVEFKAVWSGSVWTMEQGSYIGSDIVQAAIVNTQDVVLSVTAAGQIRYATGNLAGHVQSNIKVITEGLKV